MPVIEFNTGQVFPDGAPGLEVPRTNRLDRPYEVLSRPILNRIIDTPEALLAYQQALMARQGKRATESHATLIARIDAGRWLADCVCGDAPLIDPAWPIACCLGCGRIYRSIVLPANAAALETVLLARPDAGTRFWRPGQLVVDLQAENTARGVA